jgi:hypothetical protein
MGKTRHLYATILIVIGLNLLSACGEEAGQSHNPSKLAADRGGIACQVVLAPNADGAQDAPTSPSGNICKDYLISKIAVTVIDVEHDEVATPEPVVWDCDIPERRNSIGGLKPSSNMRVIVEGFVDGENDPRWVGSREEIVVEAGQYTDIGRVDLYCNDCETDPPKLLERVPNCVDLRPTFIIDFSEDIVPDSIGQIALYRDDAEGNSVEVTSIDYYPDTDYDAATHQLHIELPLLERASSYTLLIEGKDGLGIQDRYKNMADEDFRIRFNTISNWYVDVSVAYSGSGVSWVDAFKTIQEGIDAASANSCGEVWVRSGSYVVSEPVILSKPISVFGGFDGTEAARKDYQAEHDLNSWVGPDIDSESNEIITEVDHLLKIEAPIDYIPERKTVIQGFSFFRGGHEVIQVGDYGNRFDGGAMHCDYSGTYPQNRLEIGNCRFLLNSANYGGAVFFNSVLDVSISNCSFERNVSVISDSNSGGGAIYASNSKIVINGCVFRRNEAKNSGGAVFFSGVNRDSLIVNSVFFENEINEDNLTGGGALRLYVSSPSILSSTFYNNGFDFYDIQNTRSKGLSIFGWDELPTISNSIFWNDQENEIEQEIYFYRSDPNVSYSNVKGGYEGIGNINEDPRFFDPFAGELWLEFNSPCIDSGSNAIENLPLSDVDGNDRVVDGNIQDEDNRAIVDMGAYEFQPEPLDR